MREQKGLLLELWKLKGLEGDTPSAKLQPSLRGCCSAGRRAPWRGTQRPEKGVPANSWWHFWEATVGLVLQVLGTLETGTPTAPRRRSQCGKTLLSDAHRSSGHMGQQKANREKHWPRQTGGCLAERIKCIHPQTLESLYLQCIWVPGATWNNWGQAKTEKEIFCFVSCVFKKRTVPPSYMS